MARPRAAIPRSKVANVRLTETERLEMEAAASAMGMHSISEYVRYLHRNRSLPNASARLRTGSYRAPVRYGGTPLGTIYHGDCLGLLFETLEAQSVDLIMTSPPFGLVRKKTYGNEDADNYLSWFKPFALGFKRVLKDNGSLVIDIGGSWKPGTPTRSLYHFELLVMLCRDFGFHLAEEHYWWNPAKLPTPAEWVNVRRVRVKDAVNCIWWLSPTPWPKVNNRRVLAPYSASMQHLLIHGYTPKLRPSGHDISDKFQRDNGGAVPPNLIALANTESNGRYQDYCREQNLPIHPARYPVGIPAYFVKLLTDRGDFVVDPFAGSCVTGEACESLQRRWVCCDLEEDYLKGALSRFAPAPVQKGPERRAQKPARNPLRNGNGRDEMAARGKPYEIYPPCHLRVDDASTPLFKDGGQSRPTPDSSAKDANKPVHDGADDRLAGLQWEANHPHPMLPFG